MPTGVNRSRGGLLAPVLVLALLLVGAAFVVSFRAPSPAEADTAYDAEELRFLELINQYRSENGLPTLILSDALTLASERHNEDMGRYGFFAHDTAQSDHFPAGSEPWDRMALSGYDYPDSYRAENLAGGYETAEEAFQAWRASPGHDKNMRDGNQRVIGISRLEVPGSKFGWYWTTDFGSEIDPTSHAPGEPSEAQRAEAALQGAPQAQQSPEEPAPEEAPPPRREARDRAGIENGAFARAGVWRAESRDGRALVEGGVARLGGYDGAEDELSQRLRIREGQTLTYRVRVETNEERHPADGLVVRLTDRSGEHLVTIKSHTDAAARRGGWVAASVDLSRFAGQNVNLAFLTKSDEQRPTTFFVDDVRVR
jgi:uncharacterized protein YkwD